MRALRALGGLVLTVGLGGGLAYGLIAWTDWSLLLPDPWFILLSPLGALGVVLLVLIFMMFYVPREN